MHGLYFFVSIMAWVPPQVFRPINEKFSHFQTAHHVAKWEDWIRVDFEIGLVASTGFPKQLAQGTNSCTLSLRTL
jgi:hypothetical protein